jgi:hypothetical protein
VADEVTDDPSVRVALLRGSEAGGGVGSAGGTKPHWMRIHESGASQRIASIRPANDVVVGHPPKMSFGG